MTCTKVLAQPRLNGQRQETSGCSDAVILDNSGAIMKRQLATENRDQQLIRQHSVQRHAAFDVTPQSDLPFDDDQGSCLVVGELFDSRQNVFHGFLELDPRKTAWECRLPELSKRTPDLGLEHDDDQENEVRKN